MKWVWPSLQKVCHKLRGGKIPSRNLSYKTGEAGQRYFELVFNHVGPAPSFAYNPIASVTGSRVVMSLIHCKPHFKTLHQKQMVAHCRFFFADIKQLFSGWRTENVSIPEELKGQNQFQSIFSSWCRILLTTDIPLLPVSRLPPEGYSHINLVLLAY